MDAQRLLEAAEVVGELAENYYQLPEGGDVPAQAAIALTVARLYMIRYARLLAAGREPYDALAASVADALVLDQRQQDMLHLLKPEAGADE
jgi:hypothetical protein